MRFGVIPPSRALDLAQYRTYHLALAGVIQSDPGMSWKSFFRGESDRGSFITLDNGAYEGDALDIKTLYHIAEEIGASEIVLPDVLFYGDATLDATEEALRTLRGYKPLLRSSGIRLAIVPQGKTIHSWGRNIKDLLFMFNKFIGTDSIPLTITIPKHTGSWKGGRANLYEKYVDEHVLTLDAHVNLLGIGESIYDLVSMATRFPIRSIDSAKPFLYALSGYQLLHGFAPIPEAPKRPDWYFDAELEDNERYMAAINIEVFTAKLSPETMTQREILPLANNAKG